MDALSSSSSPALGPMLSAGASAPNSGGSRLIDVDPLALSAHGSDGATRSGLVSTPHSALASHDMLSHGGEEHGLGNMTPGMLDLSDARMAAHEDAHMTHSPHDMPSHSAMDTDIIGSNSSGSGAIDSSIGLLPAATTSPVDSSLLMQSNSPLLLSSSAPLIGGMPSMALDDGEGGMAALAPAEPSSIASALPPVLTEGIAPEEKAAAAALHDQIAQLQAARAALEAELEAERRAKEAAGQLPPRSHQATGRKRKHATGAAAASKARQAKRAAAVAAAVAGVASGLSGADAALAPAPAVAAPAPPPSTGIQSHSSERRHALTVHHEQALTDAITAASAAHTASLLPPNLLQCEDETVLLGLLDALSSTFNPHSRSSFLPRYLKLSQSDLRKEVAWLENDLIQKRIKHAHKVATAQANAAQAAGAPPPLISQRKATASLAATVAAIGEPSQATRDAIAAAGQGQLAALGGLGAAGGAGGAGLGKGRRRSSQAVTGAAATSVKRKAGEGAEGTPADGTAASRSSRQGGPTHPRVPGAPKQPRSKFVPQAAPNLGQIVCICKTPYDGTPVNGPSLPPPVPSAVPSVEGDAVAQAQKSKNGDQQTEGAAALQAASGECTTAAADSAKADADPAASAADAPAVDASTEKPTMDTDATVAASALPATTAADAAPMDITSDAAAPAAGLEVAAASDATVPAAASATNAAIDSTMDAAVAPASDGADAVAPGVPTTASPTPSGASSPDSGPTPPSPFLIPCQRCNAWFHPSCLRLSPLEALTPYVCRKHTSSVDAPALRQLMRPSSSRHERVLEREKHDAAAAASIAAAAAHANGSGTALSPTSPYYIPDDIGAPCPELPDENIDERDNRLFIALREMMALYHLSQSDVCISSNLSGGQAALSSCLNGRKIANIGKKQNQLRRWLWKFEQFQLVRSAHAANSSHPMSRPPFHGATGGSAALVVPALDGSLVQVGSVISAHTLEWPPLIHWRSYFTPLTPEEKIKDELARSASLEKLQERVAKVYSAKAVTQRAANYASSKEPKATSTRGGHAAGANLSASAPLSSSSSHAAGAHASAAAAAGLSSSMPRLRTVHHAPVKYGASDDEEGPTSARSTGAAAHSDADESRGQRRQSNGKGGSSSSAAASSSSVPASKRRTSSEAILSTLDSFPSLATGADPESFSHRYNIGDRIDCRVTPAADAAWLGAIVKDVRSCALQLHFMHTSHKYDQWVNTRSKRLAEIGLYSGESKKQPKVAAGASAAAAGAGEVINPALEEMVARAFKEYVRAEKEAARDGYTGGAPLWSGKKRPDLPALGSSVAMAKAARERAKAKRLAAAAASGNSSAGGSDEEPENTNEDECGVCGKGGSLLCCDGCPSSFHGHCLEPKVDMKALLASDDPWFCPKCDALPAHKKRKTM